MTDLTDYRARQAAARQRHPSVVPIWTPQDSIDTARLFALELDNAERGVSDAALPERRRESWLFSVSRERRARRMDALAVALLMIVMAVFGCVVVLLSAPHAKADTSDVYAYASHYGTVVCDVLDGHDSVGGVLGVIHGVQEHGGFTAFDAGQVVGLSVADICPRHEPLMRRFVTAYAGQVAA